MQAVTVYDGDSIKRALADAPWPIVPLDRTLEGTLGIEALEASDEHVRGRIEVTDSVRAPSGLVHGGLFSSAGESLAAQATYIALASERKVAIGLSNQTSFLRPLFDGVIHVDGRRRHRGRSTWIWDVDFADDGGSLCATTRVTLAVRDIPDASASEGTTA